MLLEPGPESIGIGSSGKAGAMVPAIALIAVSLVLSAAAFYAPPTQGEMAVVFPFGLSEASEYSAVLAAGGSIVGSTRLPNIIVAFAPDPGFAERIRAAGAFFTLAATGLCTPVAVQTET
jgi:hypothetical protein